MLAFHFIMQFLITILMGLIVGVIAKFLMPGRDPGGFIITILLGIAGAAVAGWIGRALGWYGPGDAAGFIASLFGAILLLIVYRLFQKARGGGLHCRNIEAGHSPETI
jgi:uncharacterized membrane protein YeaQ/YmgE (transglycosylase-associated protein family)